MKNHQKMEVENFDDCNTSFILMSLESKKGPRTRDHSMFLSRVLFEC